MNNVIHHDIVRSFCTIVKSETKKEIEKEREKKDIGGFVTAREDKSRC